MNFDYLIVGAGLAGSVCANLLNAAGKKVIILEKRDSVGGNLRCEDINGIICHKYGAHIFRTSNKTVWDYVNRFAEFVPFVNSPIANYRGELYNLPFNMNTFYRLWGCKNPEEARKEIAKRVERIDSPKNLEEHCMALVGSEIYEKFIKGYTEKQWGKACSELPADIMRRIPLRFTFDNNYFNDIWQGIPEGGYNKFIGNIIGNIPVLTGVDINKNKEYESIGDSVIYTGAIDEYFNYSCGRLEWRSLTFKNHIIDGTDNYQGVAVMNYTDSDVPYTRSIEHKHFLKQQCNGTVVTYEYPHPASDDNEPYYPINDERNNRIYGKYKEIADSMKKHYFVGRLAEYKYYDMQDTILSAMRLCEWLLKKHTLQK